MTGRQTGATVALSGQPVSTQPLFPGSSIILSRTSSGLGAVIDTNSAAALTVPVVFPWGLDLAPLAPAIFITNIFLGLFVVLPVATVLQVVQEGLHSIEVAIGRALTP